MSFYSQLKNLFLIDEVNYTSVSAVHSAVSRCAHISVMKPAFDGVVKFAWTIYLNETSLQY